LKLTGYIMIILMSESNVGKMVKRTPPSDSALCCFTE
jgi:hypothetical protein